MMDPKKFVPVIRRQVFASLSSPLAEATVSVRNCKCRLILKNGLERPYCIEWVSSPSDTGIVDEAVRQLGYRLIPAYVSGPVRWAIKEEDYLSFDTDFPTGRAGFNIDPFGYTGKRDQPLIYPLLTRISPETEAALLANGAGVLDTSTAVTDVPEAYCAVPVMNIRNIPEPFKMIHMASAPAMYPDQTMNCGEALYRGESGTFYIRCQWPVGTGYRLNRVAMHPQLLGCYDQNPYLLSAYAGILVNEDKCFPFEDLPVASASTTLDLAAQALAARRASEVRSGREELEDIPAGAALLLRDPGVAETIEMRAGVLPLDRTEGMMYFSRTYRSYSDNPIANGAMAWRTDYSGFSIPNLHSSCTAVAVCLTTPDDHVPEIRDWFEIKLASAAAMETEIGVFLPWLKKAVEVGFKRVVLEQGTVMDTLALAAGEAGLKIISRPEPYSDNDKLFWLRKYINQQVFLNRAGVRTLYENRDKFKAALDSIIAGDTALFLPPRKTVARALVLTAVPAGVKVLC